MIYQEKRASCRQLLAATLGLLLAFVGNDAMAQCSRGGQSGSPRSGSQSTLTMPSSLASAGGRGIRYPRPQTLSMSQMNLLSSAMQISAQQKYAMAAYQQNRMSNRMARAEMTRAKRAERIALAKARRESNQRYASSGTEIQSTPKVTLVSLSSDE